MKKIFLTIPGIHGSDDNHWQSLWEKRYRNFKRVNQFNWDHPDASEWVKTLDEKISRYPHHAIYLIAHSMGCHTVARWAAQSDRHIAGALLVAPPNVEKLETDGRVTGYANRTAIKLPFNSILIASSNDVYASTETAKAYANEWGSYYLNIGEAGHINSNSGIGQWEDGLRFLHFLQTQNSHQTNFSETLIHGGV